MDVLQAIWERHSVRAYLDRPIEGETLEAMLKEIDSCNRESGLRMQLVTEEPEAFTGPLAYYGRFRNVRNYVALVGPEGPKLEETVGFYGERFALRAQQLGLNTCWVAATFRKKRVRAAIGAGEKLVCVLALGYGTTPGVPHRSKPMEAVCSAEGEMPNWFKAGVQAALLAPTAVNQQRFYFTLENGTVRAKATGGTHSEVDLGIVKYHFTVGAGSENFRWA